MKNTLKKLSLRLISMLLCVITFFTFAEISAFAALVSQADTGAKLPYELGELADTGVSIGNSADKIVSENYSVSKPVTTETAGTRYVKETIPRYNVRYAVMHVASGNVMSYDATNPTETATSLVYSQDSSAYASYHYGEKNGEIDESVIYFDNSLRDSALWLLRQRKREAYGNLEIQNYDELSHQNNGSNTMGYVDTTATRYHHSIYFKGIGPTRSATGAVVDAVNGAYWNSVNGADAENVQERFLYLSPENVYHYEENDTVNDIDARTLITEALNDGTFLVYRRHDSVSPVEYNFLYCDPETGEWGNKHFATRAEAQAADLDSLKLRFYYYESTGVKRALSVSGDQNYHVLEGTSQEELVNYIADSIKIVDTTQNDMQVAFSGTESKIGRCWLSFDNEFDSSADRAHSDYVVKINYCNDNGLSTVIGALSVTVHEKMTIKDSASVALNSGVVVQNSNIGAIVQKYTDGGVSDCTFTVQTKSAQGIKTDLVPLTVGMLTDSEGNPVNTAVNGVYTGLTVNYAGEVIATSFTLTVEDSSEALNYPEYPEEGSVKVSKSGEPVGVFKETGVANIQLGATGIPMSKGVDLVVILDLSGSMSYALDRATDAVDGELSRVEALQESLVSMFDTLKASNVDFRIAMSDFGDIDSYEFDGAFLDPTIKNKFFFDGDRDGEFDQRSTWQFGSRREFYNHLNYVHGTYLEDETDESGNVLVDHDNRAMPNNISARKYNKAYPTYTGKIVPNVYTGSQQVNADAFVSVDSFDEEAVSNLMAKITKNQKNSLGTNYDVGLEYAYQLGHAIQQDNIAKGEDRELLCVFMSDGCAMQYNYFSGRTVSQAWADWLNGEIKYDELQHDVFDETGDSTELTALMDKMLGLLKKGELKRPDHKIAYTPIGTSVNALASQLEPVTKEVDGVTGSYFDLSAEGTATAETFYKAMSLNGVTLQWSVLNDIAAANGLKGYASMAEIEDELLALAQSNMLKYPSSKLEFYDKYEGNETDFFKAMNAMDIDCNWELFVQIAQLNGYQMDLQRAYGEVTTLAEGKNWGTLSPYYYFYNEEGKSWMAEAIKGSSTEVHPVINKYAFAASTEQPYEYYGDVRNRFDTGTGLPLDGQDYISGYRGLDMPIYTVGFSLCTEVYLSESTAKGVLEKISSGPSYAFTANTREELTDVFNSIAVSATQAATRAYYVDTMGPEYDLYTRKTVVSENGEVINIDAETVIHVYEYTLDPVTHKRTGNRTVLETVTISENPDGSLKAISDKIYNIITNEDGTFVPEYPNIFGSDGVITAKNFRYNTNKYVDESKDGSIKIDLTGDNVGDFSLPAESFFWILGPIGQTELVLDYNVYLEGALEGLRLPGVFETNTSAVLSYINYLGNNCTKATVSPELTWPGAVAGYGFYLVDENGNPISAEGAVTDFDNAYKLTEPEFVELLFNGETMVVSPEEKLSELMSLKYSLYDPQALYNITFSTIEGSSNWVIEKGNDVKATTYVTNYGGNPTTLDSADVELDKILFDRSIVWFALKYTYKANPDTVVIDYGIPVDVDVLANDISFEDNYSLSFVDTEDMLKNLYDQAKESAPNLSFDMFLQNLADNKTPLFDTLSVSGDFGSAEKNGDLLRYTLDNAKGMQMEHEDTFVYAAHYNDASNPEASGYYYSTLTVIPATSIYYEDNFVSYSVLDYSTGKEITPENPVYEQVKWTTEGETLDRVQAQDRPGEYIIPELDANSIYGYDSAYADSTTYSLGSAKKVNVGKQTLADGTTQNTRAEAKFTFTGTGFDIVSLTSNTTGTVIIQVSGKGSVAGVNKYYMVDTYYGYKYDTSTNQWIVDTEADNALYQIPVMKVDDLPYGKYDVTLSVTYTELFDHQQYGDAQNFDFYLDAIRIYNPANNGESNSIIEDAYVADAEGWPVYEEVRNIILKADSFGSSADNRVVNGAVFIDNTAREEGGAPSIEDYTNYGPNNEVYLAPGQAIAFKLESNDSQHTHVAVKSVTGADVSVKLFNAELNQAVAKVNSVTTSTDLYYDITNLNGKTVVIYNCSTSPDSILSVTNIKTTFAQKPASEVRVASFFRVSNEIAALALSSFAELPEEETTSQTETTEVTVTKTEETTESTIHSTTVQENFTTEAIETTAASESATSATVQDDTEVTEITTASTEATQPSVYDVLGDTNLDGILNIRDATVIRKYIAKLISLEEKAEENADFDLNGKVSIKDATEIQKEIAGIN